MPTRKPPIRARRRVSRRVIRRRRQVAAAGLLLCCALLGVTGFQLAAAFTGGSPTTAASTSDTQVNKPAQRALVRATGEYARAPGGTVRHCATGGAGILAGRPDQGALRRLVDLGVRCAGRCRWRAAGKGCGQLKACHAEQRTAQEQPCRRDLTSSPDDPSTDPATGHQAVSYTHLT